MYLILLLIFFIRLVNSVSFSVDVEKTFFFQDYGEIFAINSYSYRESVTPYGRGYFSIKLSSGNYNLTKLPFSHTISIITYSKISNLDKIITSNKWKTIDKVTIYLPKKHSLGILVNMNSVSNNGDNNSNNNLPKIRLLVNDKIFGENKTDNFIYYNILKLETDNYHIEVQAKSDNSPNWCSCPTLGNGFKNTHQLAAWITPDDTNFSDIDSSSGNSIDSNLVNPYKKTFIKYLPTLFFLSNGYN